MSSPSLFDAAEALDRTPLALWDAHYTVEALNVLRATAPIGEQVAHRYGLDLSRVAVLWNAAADQLRDAPADEDSVITAAADIAVLLYTAASLLSADEEAADGLRHVI